MDDITWLKYIPPNADFSVAGEKYTKPGTSRPVTAIYQWEEEGLGTWLMTEETVRDWRPIDQFDKWCSTCKNAGGWWTCDGGRMCNACQCDHEMEYHQCPQWDEEWHVRWDEE